MFNYEKFYRYPRTPHVEGSGVQSDDLKEITPLSFFEGKYIVLEEKCDGGCSAFRLHQDTKRLFAQSRGHYLFGGDEPYWDDLKRWIAANEYSFSQFVQNEFIVYGEYMKAYHSVYYDQLPHFFLEFDIYNMYTGEYYDTPTRYQLLQDFCPEVDIQHVPVLAKGVVKDGMLEGRYLLDYLGQSRFISLSAYNILADKLEERKIVGREVLLSLNKKALMEGLYLKWEEDGIVKGRYKYVRPEFVQTIIEEGQHWKTRANIYNELAS
jgi:hypothetical protein